jgi:hypothetical protein
MYNVVVVINLIDNFGKVVKMQANKYIVKATIQTLAYYVSIAIIGLATAAILEYINPTATQVVGTLLVAFVCFATYNMIKIQASILESRDKIN